MTQRQTAERHRPVAPPASRPALTHEERRAAKWLAQAEGLRRDAIVAGASGLNKLSDTDLVNCAVNQSTTPHELAAALQYRGDPRVFAKLFASKCSDVKLKTELAGAITNLLNGQKDARTAMLREAANIIRFQEKAEEIALEHVGKSLTELRASAAQLLSIATEDHQRANLATAFSEAATLCQYTDRANLMREIGQAFLTGSVSLK